MDFKARWNRIYRRHAGGPEYWSLAPTYHSFRSNIVPILRDHARGRTLDLGAGQLVLRALAVPFIDSYVSLDLARRHPDLSVQGDVLDLPFSADAFDTVLMTQVLEHVPAPGRALAEVARVLRPGGRLIVSVPHLAYVHDEPHDYYRFTRYGLAHLLGEVGLAPIRTTFDGSLATFLGNVPAIGLLALTEGHPALARLVLKVNRLLCRGAAALDRTWDQEGRFAVNVIAVAEKRPGNRDAGQD